MLCVTFDPVGQVYKDHSHQRGQGLAKGELLKAAFSCTLGPKDIPKAMALESHTDQGPRSSVFPGPEEAQN